jgi:hypothetical protein
LVQSFLEARGRFFPSKGTGEILHYFVNIKLTWKRGKNGISMQFVSSWIKQTPIFRNILLADTNLKYLK